MISVERGAAPVSLVSTRRRKLRKLRALKKIGNLDESAIKFSGYGTDEVRDALYGAQFQKCVYCEMSILRRGYHVEHFRPKGAADRGPGFATHGYFWLAWNWDNLFLACPACDSAAKRTQFPLEVGSRILPRFHGPPGPERALLIDPGRENPLDEILFVKLKQQWRPVAKNNGLRGRKTIEVLQLDASDLRDKYNRHVENRVEPLVREVETRIDASDARRVHDSWEQLLRRLFGAWAPFKALSFDVVDLRVNADIRAEWGLILLRP